MRAHDRGGRVLLVGLALAVAACGGATGPDVPDGFQVVDHPRGSVAVPADWERADGARGIDALDPEVIRYQIPGIREEVEIGLTMFAVATEGEGFEAAAVRFVLPMVDPGSPDQDRRESTEVAGSDDAMLVEVREATATDGVELRGTYVAAQADDGMSLVVRLLGPTDVLTDDLVDDIIGSLEVTGG